MFDINKKYYFEFNYKNYNYCFDVYSIKFINGKIDCFSFYISDVYKIGENSSNFNPHDFIKYIDKEYGFKIKESPAFLIADVDENNINLLKCK